MRLLLPLLLCLLLPPALADEPPDDEAVLRHFKTVLWPQAYRTQDTALLARLLHESFEMLDDAGNRSTRQKELEAVAAEAWDPGEFRYEIERLEIYDGRFAVIDGRGIASDYTYVSSNYLVKQDGRWQAIGSHVSGFRRTAGEKAAVD